MKIYKLETYIDVDSDWDEYRILDFLSVLNNRGAGAWFVLKEQEMADNVKRNATLELIYEN